MHGFRKGGDCAADAVGAIGRNDDGNRRQLMAAAGGCRCFQNVGGADLGMNDKADSNGDGCIIDPKRTIAWSVTVDDVERR